MRVPTTGRRATASYDASRGGATATRAAAGRLVVGVTASQSSVAALTWALAAARDRGWTIDVVSVWPDLGEVFVHEAPGHFCQPRSRAVDAVTAALAACRVDPATEARLRVWVENADPVAALVTRSEGADLLVVGAATNGRSRRSGCPAVGLTCAALASCRVVVVDEVVQSLRPSA